MSVLCSGYHSWCSAAAECGCSFHAAAQQLLNAAAPFLVHAGEIAPQPPLQHSLGNAPAALRQLGAAKTVGKIVAAAPPADAQPGRWVVTGGLGALGTSCAR